MSISKELLKKYELTVGIECHVQLKTKTKLFAAVSNDASNAEPNTTVSPICFALPGVLPVLNSHAVELAIFAGLALNAKVANFSKFDRKHYFYPDLPKGYQITQFDQPIIGEGYVDISVNNGPLRIRVERAHLEEDAGKLIHPENKDYSLVDLNRAGTPLLEIVSKPDIHSAEAAKAYVQELYLLMKYAGVSDVDLYNGQMRFDVNVSVAKKGSKQLGTRSEVKNLNSFRSVEKSVEYEYERQIRKLEAGEKVVQETRGWNDMKQTTFSQRSKEEANDYRYFPEPDIPPVIITDKQIEKSRSKLPILPAEIRAKLGVVGLTPENANLLMRADIASNRTNNESYVTLILAVADISKPAAEFAFNWIANFQIADTEKLGVEGSTAQSLPTSSQLVEVYKMFKVESQLSSNNAYSLLQKLSPKDDPRELAKRLNLLQVSDQSELDELIEQVIADNAKAAQDVANGQDKAIGFLVGQVMKLSKGQANPQLVQKTIRQKLQVK